MSEVRQSGMLTGTRIRKRRLDLGLKQGELARSVGVSPAYLNLIEHNKRRIGGKLLGDLARRLGVEATVLSEGAGAGLLEVLQEAAQLHEADAPPLESAQDFAARLPGWAALLAGLQQRGRAMGRRIEALSDRLAHDPLLSEALHALLSSVTAIRSTAAILAESRDLEPAWQARFQRNMNEDARRLAEEAQRLAAYLDGAPDGQATLASPHEELEAFLAAQGWHLPMLEGIGAEEEGARIERLIADSPVLSNSAARDLARGWLQRLAADARALPLAPFQAACRAAIAGEAGAGGLPDPAALAQHFGADLARVLRRLALMPAETGAAGGGIGPTGLVICDQSGALNFRKPLPGFSLPRFGTACALWPLYQALGQAMRPLVLEIEMPGPVPRRFATFTIALARPQPRMEVPVILDATMLVLPADTGAGVSATPPASTPRPVGSSCRTCPRAGCAARREPSILAARAEAM